MYIDMYDLIKAELAAIASLGGQIQDFGGDRYFDHAHNDYHLCRTIPSWITSDWELVERVIDFHAIADEEHEGKYAGLGLAKQLAELQVIEKIPAALDNASPNDVLIRTLSRLLMEKFGVQFDVIVWPMSCTSWYSSYWRRFEEAVDPAVTDDYVLNKDLPFHYDINKDRDLNEFEREEFTAEDLKGDEEGEAAALLNGLASEFEKISPLKKLRTTATEIFSSQRCNRFRTTSEKIYGKKLAPSGRELATLMVAIDSLVLEREELRPLFLKAEDWKLLEALGISWFQKMESERPKRETDLLSAARAEVIFKHVYQSYQDIHAADSTQPQAPIKRSQPGTHGSFLDHVCMVDVAESTVPEVTNYSGDRNATLTWWKPRTITEVMLTKMWIKEGLLKKATLECGGE
ncbi:hypothetical protein DFH07DRAFT_773938 [Mycena maculata]|uniref:Uncharacterized protein n=1 Tax=Mycena maculata TaxID=230809 RepID=A0AAD7NCF5_9AGAR|nr:hypothetical protein DFH07DRAFT_773938 [Mycena maculata]